ncbi:hypothetical protein SUGI_0745270 [Cryptomeria japonica]|uniref:transportin MOS14 n=1 Tax=Cryptomeria japonica TaxID=3369 RepID=UPI002414A55C|nr:transportin MOS14 [Cryptomeria japonica]GLJ36877.1 hypothetical protein SUGI_0745270 [Cryptomeria japonica]
MAYSQQVEAALRALYHHPDAPVRRDANKWLQDFQRSMDAWQVSDTLLHHPDSNLETLIFSSQTLKAKVQRDFEELPPEAFVPLRESLKNLLKKFCKGPNKVRTQISIAMAALAVHVPAQEWGGGHLNWLINELGTTPEYIHSFLELVTVIPQEAYSYKIAAHPERHRQFLKELVASVEVAFNLLDSFLAFEELHEQVLDAFSSWLRLSNGIPVSTLASHNLVQASLAGLNSDKLFDAAVNAICELIHYTVSGSPDDIQTQMPLIQVLVPHVMGLRSRFGASLKSARGEAGMGKTIMEDEEIVKGMARLFVEMGDAYAQMIATGSQESLMIVDAILEVTSHPEYDIAAMSFNFWHTLQLILTRREYYGSFQNDATIDAEKERRLAIFRPIFELLVSLVCFRVTYPQNYDQWSMEILTDFKRTRYAVGDMLMDAASVLGGENILKILSNNFIQLATRNVGNDASWDWRPVEASLYCIRAISRAVSTSEGVVMPQVMDLLPKLPLQSQLLHTECLTIAGYSKWLGSAPSAPSFLPSIIEVLIRGMTTAPDVSTAASLALRNVCNACRDKLASSLEGLFMIYHEAVSGQSNYKLSNDDALQLIEALSTVITALPAEHAKRALESLWMPVVTPLQQVITQEAQSSQQMNANQYTVPIDRIANIFRFVNLPEVVTDAFQKMWPIFKEIFVQRAWDMITMERLCRACKYAVRTCGKSMAIIMGNMLQEVQMQYTVHHQSCFLYLASEVIKVFGSDPSCANYLGGLITELFGQTVGLLKTIQEFTSRPDIADDCFLLASRCIRYCPHLLISSSVFASLVECAMTGVTIQHREACQSILTFFIDIFDIAMPPTGNQYRSVIDNVILVRGANLTRILLAGLVGALPEPRVEEVISVLLSFARTYGGEAIKWSQEAINLIPSTTITNEERWSVLQSISSAASGENNPGFTCSLEDLSDICRRSKATQDQVQEALQLLSYCNHSP